MSSDLLGTAVTGLRVSQSALSTIGHNIANAGVDGYSRQVARAETNPATPQGGFYVGNGASIASIERQVNEFLTQQLRTDTTLHNELDIFYDNITQLDSLLSDSSTGLSGAFESFFASMQNGADDPTSIPARQLIISESDNLADRFNTVYDRLLTISDGVDSALGTAVEEVNAITKNIANLNQKIADANGTGLGSPNDLLDQRDQALKELAKYISFQSYEQGFGEVNVLVGSGQNLVVGSQAREIGLDASRENSAEKQIVFVGELGSQPIPSNVIGGEIGGLFRFRDDVLDDTYNKIGRIAVVLADTFNSAHNTGINLNNEFGGDFFGDVNNRDAALERVIASSENAPPSDRVLNLSILDSSQLGLSDYRLEMVNDGLLSITRLSDNSEVARELLPGAYPFSVIFDGMELEFEQGSFQSGDSFLIQPVRSGARDFTSALVDPNELAFGLPLLTDTTLGNLGSGEISPGQILSLTDVDGNPLPLFATPGQMSPPLMVRFTSQLTYEILDNSDPAAPVALSPPMSNLRYVPGTDNALFPTDPNETMVQTLGADIGLPVGSVAVIGGGPTANGYPSETITVTRQSAIAGGAPTTQTVITSTDASARTTASVLNNISGVVANASTYAELSNTQNLSLTTPLQININGEDLVEYEFDSGLGVFVVAAVVPDPTVDEAAFNDYIADRINGNSTLGALGIYAVAGRDATTGIEEIRLHGSLGDDLTVILEADNADTMSVSDGGNPTVALNGNGVGITSAIAVGGSIDIRLEDGLSLDTIPVISGLFGDSSAANFAQSTYLGIQASIRGTPQTGDTFTLDFNQDAASDNRNILDMVNLANVATVGNGVSSYTDSYASLVETIGIETSSANINRNAAEQVLEQSQEQRNSVSAVNLDEEAADLIRFEQMYSANTQVISVARDLFDRLISSF